LRRLGVIAVAAACAAVLSGGADAVSAKQTPRPVVSWIDATPDSIPAHGGAVLVRAYVRSAVLCAFAEQHGSSARIVHVRTVGCKAGHATVRVTVPANRTSHLMVVRFRVTAASATHRRVTKRVEVVQQPSTQTTPPPAPVDADTLAIQTSAVPPGSVGAAYSTTLTAIGGTAPYTWSITGGTLPPGLALGASGALSGTPSTAGTWSFTAQVGDGRHRVATTPYVLTVTGGGPTGTSSPFLSTNWSGYALTGGPFTGATGSFNVPTLYAATVDSTAAEWVGIDGTSASNPGIIQAGVLEDWSTESGSYVVVPWVELYPAPPFPLPLTVSSGDQMTVTIAQEGPGAWNVVVSDDTTGQTFSENETYAGPAESAEWIVEAPYSTLTQSVIPLATFSPVTFGRLGVNPINGSLARIVMIQNGVTVSTPSDLTPNGFTVAYGSVTPGAP
jgi:hypothetical protein